MATGYLCPWRSHLWYLRCTGQYLSHWLHPIETDELFATQFIHPKAIPPPSGKLPAYILYILACLTTILLFYLFAIRPCTQRRRLKKVKAENPAGLTVLPITQALAGGGKKGKKGKGKKGKKGQQDPGAVQVNLIVDPTMFGSNRERRDRNQDEDDDDWDEEDERDEADRRSRRSDRRAPQRRSVFQGLAMEKAWGAARSWLKWTLFIDLVCMILWGGEFVLILLGKRCPSGEFEGWYVISSSNLVRMLIELVGATLTTPQRHAHVSSLSLLPLASFLTSRISMRANSLHGQESSDFYVLNVLLLL